MIEKGKPKFFYGWIVVGVLSISMLLAYIIRSSFSVFYVAILQEFGWTRADTAGIFSLYLIVYGLGGIAIGILLDKLGPQKLFPIAATLIALGGLWCSRATKLWEFYVAFGVVVGLGQCGSGYVPTMTVVNHWFVKKRGLALGITMFGLSLSFLFSPLTQYLRETVGWRVAFMIYACVVFAIVVPLTNIFLRHRPQDVGLLPDGAKQAAGNEPKTGSGYEASIVDPKWASVAWTLPKAFKTYRLWLLLGVAIMMGIMFNFPQVHKVAFITDVGYSAMFAVTVFSIYGLLGVIGPLGGFLSDRIGRELICTLGASGVVIGTVIALLIRSPGLEWAWYLSALSYGLGIGLLQPTLPAAYGDVFAGKNLGSIIGFINAGFGIGGALGSFVGGYIYDVTRRYTLAFVIILAAAITLTTLLWLVGPRKIRLVAGKTPKKSL